jgi:hypothetical protein
MKPFSGDELKRIMVFTIFNDIVELTANVTAPLDSVLICIFLVKRLLDQSTSNNFDG